MGVMYCRSGKWKLCGGRGSMIHKVAGGSNQMQVAALKKIVNKLKAKSMRWAGRVMGNKSCDHNRNATPIVAPT